MVNDPTGPEAAAGAVFTGNFTTDHRRLTIILPSTHYNFTSFSTSFSSPCVISTK
jgi:hypothetical protein